MGWSSAINYIKNMVLPEDVEDSNLPFKAKIGGVVDIQMTPFIQASTQGGLIRTPNNTKSLTIKAISKVKLDLTGEVYRYYLNKGDGLDIDEEFIQVYCLNDKPVEVLYCQSLGRIYPETKEEQNLYLGKYGKGLGEIEYTIWKDQIIESELYTEAQVNDIFQGQESFTYTRVYGGEKAFVKPMEGKETRIDDSKGLTGLEQNTYYCQYGRCLTTLTEYLLINTEIIESIDGNSLTEIHVDFMIAVPLEIERIKIN